METEIKKTCLHGRHTEMGAKMSPFAGFDMPIEYAGLDREHNAVRTTAGVFDVSHMGEVEVTGPEAAKFVNHIFTNDVTPMKKGQAIYGMMCKEDGGVVDDLLVYKFNDHHFLLVINAGNIDKDVAWIATHAVGFDCSVKDRCNEFGQIAVQGPDSEKVLKEVLGLDGSDLTFYTFKVLPGDREDEIVILSRTGYTGEDGFEVYAAPGMILKMWDDLNIANVEPCGLGCRDTLRFEVGLPLYGDELTEEITPIEAGLGMFVKLDKEGGFIGRDALAKQKAEGPRKKLVGLEIDSPATARHGFEVLDLEGAVVGHITTGYNSISVGKNIAMAMVDADYAGLGSKLQVKIRRKLAPATVVKKRFYTPNYKK